MSFYRLGWWTRLAMGSVALEWCTGPVYRCMCLHWVLCVCVCVCVCVCTMWASARLESLYIWHVGSACGRSLVFCLYLYNCWQLAKNQALKLGKITRV